MDEANSNIPANKNAEKSSLLAKLKTKQMILIGIAIVVVAAGITTTLLLTKKKTPTAKEFATQQTAVPDVITRQTFDCQPRTDHEWYRTDRTLVVDYKDPNVMYVNVEYKGVFKSTDGGATWTQKTKGIKVYARSDDKTKGCYSEYPVMRIDPKDHLHLVLGISGGGGGFLDNTTPNSQTGGVYQSFDGGEHWKLMITNKMNIYVTDIAIDPKNPKTVYYGTASNPASYTEADQNKLFVTKGLIYKTTNTGESWEELPTGIGQHTSVTALMINPKNSQEITASTFSANRESADGTGTGLSTGKDTAVTQLGILHTLDGGKTWSASFTLPSNPPVLAGFFSRTNYQHMYFVPSNPGSNTPSGYVLLDGKTPQATKYLDIVAYDPYDATGNHLLGFTSTSIGPANQNLVMYESTDGGLNWQKHGTLPKEITDPSDTKTRISTIFWSPVDAKTLYMSGAGGNVWKSSDLGQTWASLLDYTKLPK